MLGVAEGIENALAASKLFSVPVWSTLNEVMLAKWLPPDGVSQVIVFGDNDRRCVGQQAAFTAARRMWDRDIQARVELPPATDTDWNDVLRQRLQNQRDNHFSARSAA